MSLDAESHFLAGIRKTPVNKPINTESGECIIPYQIVCFSMSFNNDTNVKFCVYGCSLIIYYLIKKYRIMYPKSPSIL